jgi:hypothetical protein
MNLSRICLILALTAAATRGEEPTQTFVTLKGERFEKARITEVTPATITIVHAAGVATVPLSELPAELQKQFGYDEAKAKAWLAEVARAEQTRREHEAAERAAAEKRAAQQAQHDKEAVDRIAHYLDDGGRLEYDPVTKQLYDPAVAAARRREAWKFYQRYGRWPDQ